MAAISSRPKAQTFSLKTPYLSEGRTTEFVSRTDIMSIAVKVYSEGGENAPHTHLAEDHAFIILEGEATFYDENDTPTVVHRYEGITLPRGAYYYFKSTGDTNLVILRCGANVPGYKGDSRMAPNGEPLPSESAANKHITGVPVPGRFFGA